MCTVKISETKLAELQENLKEMEDSLQADKYEAAKQGGPMDSHKEAAAIAITMQAKQSKVDELKKILSNIELLPDKIPGDKIELGKWFELSDGKASVRYRLVDPVEAEPRLGLVSAKSPLGLAVYGKSKDYTFTLNSRKMKVIAVI
jgi:transcription elongation GreA/GreB family factor